MDAINFLIKEHHRVRKMFNEISEPTHRFETQKKHFNDLAQALIRHEEMEHQVWYPYFKGKLPSTVSHLLTEERHAEKEIHKLNNLKNSEAWQAHFLKLKEDVEHHASEEENDLFPEVAKIFSKQELEKIGKRLYQFKRTH